MEVQLKPHHSEVFGLLALGRDRQAMTPAELEDGANEARLTAVTPIVAAFLWPRIPIAKVDRSSHDEQQFSIGVYMKNPMLYVRVTGHSGTLVYETIGIWVRNHTHPVVIRSITVPVAYEICDADAVRKGDEVGRGWGDRGDDEGTGISANCKGYAKGNYADRTK